MKIKSFIMSVLFGFMLSACDLGDYESVLVTPHYSIFYSPDFARRFSLPVEKAIDLNNAHLKAVAIGIEKINRNYECNIHFYYDNAIKLYSPNGQSLFVHTSYKDVFFAKNYNELDFQFNYANVDNNSGRIFYQTKNTGVNVKGFYSSARYSLYKKNILPNLNMVSVLVGCGYLESQYGDAEVRIQKAGVSNYKLIDEDSLNIKHPENSYQFDVPQSLLQIVKPMIDRINAMPADPYSLNVSVQYGAK